jgi:serine/threonine protein kinase
MGQVYLARSPGGRSVAVKVIRPELAAKRGFHDRFAREVAAARNVNGIFTAAVVDADPDADLPWMATAYVEGPSLADAVEERGPLTEQAVLSLAAGLAEGLQAIHEAGLVHRDLKPTNVLLAADGPRIIDFGISWAREESRLTDAGIVVGSPGFLSPEQARGREVGPASDVFCLGAVLTYAATAQEPFGDGSTQALLYRVVNEPPDLSLVPGGLRQLIGACLAKEPGHRPTTAQLLDRLADSLPPLDGPDELTPYGGTATRAPRSEPAATMAAEIPVTGDRLSLTAAYGSLSPGRPPRSPGFSRSHRAAPAPPSRLRRWWPAAAALAACTALGVGVSMTLASSGSPSPQLPPPAPLVIPVVPSTAHGPATRLPASHGPLTPSSAAATGQTATTRPPATSAATTPAATRKASPSSATPTRSPSSLPTTTSPASTFPPASPTPTCVLICVH